MNHENLVNQKLNDKQMRENLSRAMHTLQTNRKKLVDSKFSDWQGLRSSAKIAKNNALSKLDDLLLKFETNALKNGFKVLWADSSEDACELVLEIMKEKNIGKILKGKSMASEEIGINHYLKEKGLRAIETDLGEVIIQLIDESPVHIVVPAIHKNRYEIGEIFHEHLNAPLESEPEKLNAIARTYLRDHFESLQMGMSGVNFAIANEGAIWLIENEGNGRMCTTAPDIHIAICGIEKVVESFEDAATVCTLLTPSATGQFIPAYNNIITGPRKNGDLDGPKESYIILLNNHRSDMLTNEDYYEALRCIRCGACLNFCPVYDKIGGHAYGAVYPGPIGEVVSPQIFGMDKNSDMLSFCSLCGRCSEVCPVKIPLAELIRKLRRDKVLQGKNPPLNTNFVKQNNTEKAIFSGFEKIATNGFIWRNAIGNASKFNWFLHTFGSSVPVLKNWTTFKELPQIKGNLYDAVKNMEGVIYE